MEIQIAIFEYKAGEWVNWEKQISGPTEKF
jgi:hypothetical protein